MCSEKMRKGKDVDYKGLSKILEVCKSELNKLEDSDWNKDSVKDVLWPIAEAEGRGIVLWAVRVSLSGKEKSPDPFILAETLGKDEVLLRIEKAKLLLEEVS